MINKIILITGGAGFVGSHLSEFLVRKNKVYVLDNYFTGSKKNHIKGVIYKKGETKNAFSLFKNLKSIDYIFHLGEYSRVEQSFYDLEKVMRYNVQSFFEIVKLTMHFNSKLIYCGSSTKYAIYGKNDHHSPYAWSKKNNTEFLINFAKYYKIKYAITYFYNVYGDREIEDGKYATVIAKFIKLKSKKTKYLEITRPGTQRRNFTHVKDIISGLIKVAEDGNGDGYGSASNKSYSIIELAKILDIPYKLMPKKMGNRLNGKVDVSKTKKLGWASKYDLKKYIKQKLNN